jgi:glutaredoxin-like protein NrdH
MKITVYGKPNCVQCHYTRTDLEDSGITYEYRDVTTDSEADAQAHQLVAEYHLLMNLPIVVVRNNHRQIAWAGYKRDKLKGLRKTGEY